MDINTYISPTTLTEEERSDDDEAKPKQPQYIAPDDNREHACDVEAQNTPNSRTQIALPQSKFWMLGVWLSLNLVLTLSNKAILARARLPWLLTSLHTLSTTLGCLGCVATGSLKPTHLTARGDMVMIAFSTLFTINIVTSNVSLAMVSVPLHQVSRSTCPIAAMLIESTLGRRYTMSTWCSILPLIVGVALTTAGDYRCSLAGLCMTIFGVFLAALKTVVTNRVMTGSLTLRAMDVLLRMSPLATLQCLLCAYFNGELRTAYQVYVVERHTVWTWAFVLLGNGIIAFLLNVVSLQANNLAGALTMTVAGNIKQTLTIMLGIVVFHVPTGLLNVTGIVVTVAGAGWYSKLELKNKR